MMLETTMMNMQWRTLANKQQECWTQTKRSYTMMLIQHWETKSQEYPQQTKTPPNESEQPAVIQEGEDTTAVIDDDR
eukprot:2849890-Ditylum_brightwellii.AAC.1